MYELPDGGIQMYVRDPAGNLVELDHPDASTIPQDEVPEYKRLADLRPQEGEAARGDPLARALEGSSSKAGNGT